MKVSRTMNEYMCTVRHDVKPQIKMEGQAVPETEQLKCPGTTIQEDGSRRNARRKRVQAGRKIWRKVTISGLASTALRREEALSYSTGSLPNFHDYNQEQWIVSNRQITSHSRTAATMHRWKLSESDVCDKCMSWRRRDN